MLMLFVLGVNAIDFVRRSRNMWTIDFANLLAIKRCRAFMNYRLNISRK